MTDYNLCKQGLPPGIDRLDFALFTDFPMYLDFETLDRLKFPLSENKEINLLFYTPVQWPPKKVST